MTKQLIEKLLIFPRIDCYISKIQKECYWFWNISVCQLDFLVTTGLISYINVSNLNFSPKEDDLFEEVVVFSFPLRWIFKSSKLKREVVNSELYWLSNSYFRIQTNVNMVHEGPFYKRYIYRGRFSSKINIFDLCIKVVIFRALQKVLPSLLFLVFQTHSSPWLRSWFSLSWSQSRAFYLYGKIHLRTSFCYLPQNPDTQRIPKKANTVDSSPCSHSEFPVTTGLVSFIQNWIGNNTLLKDRLRFDWNVFRFVCTKHSESPKKAQTQLTFLDIQTLSCSHIYGFDLLLQDLNLKLQTFGWGLNSKLFDLIFESEILKSESSWNMFLK